ncbi:MAG: ABC transporter permease [Desulfomonile sp.]|nr:ABC transporter permease [Desulfomonile sp.]
MSKAAYINLSPAGTPFSRFVNLLWALAMRDLTGKYRRSALGLWWAFIQPLVLMLVFSMLRGFVNIPSDGLPYILFSYAALVPWTFFANSLSSCGPSIIDNAEVIKKIALPREVFPLAGITSAFFDFLMSGILLAGMMVWYKVPVGWSLVWLPVLVALAAAVAFSIGMLVAGLGTFRKDFIFAVPFLVQVWLFVTPVIYPISSVPDRWYFLYLLNPMVGVIEGFRTVLLKASPPPTEPLLASVAVTAVLLAVSWPTFRRLSAYFADVL